ncbi:hypothetical protein L208DRAFT_1415071 [Tricholoma matsutake]|nr:hypothetical protein L208DRAFT_1415071 [Tricholoma matsutake 945]
MIEENIIQHTKRFSYAIEAYTYMSGIWVLDTLQLRTFSRRYIHKINSLNIHLLLTSITSRSTVDDTAASLMHLQHDLTSKRRKSTAHPSQTPI